MTTPADNVGAIVGSV